MWTAIFAFALAVGSVALAAFGGRLLALEGWSGRRGWVSISVALLVLVGLGASLYADLARHAPGLPRTTGGLDRGEVYRFMHRVRYDGEDYALATRIGQRPGPPTFIRLDEPMKEPCFVVMDQDGDKVLLGIDCPNE